MQDDHNFLYLAENLRVPKNLYERIAEMADYKKYTSALLMILFDRETLATHSLQGRRTTFSGDDCPKPQLPPEILRSIIGGLAPLNFKHSQQSRITCVFINPVGWDWSEYFAPTFRSRGRQVQRWPEPDQNCDPHKAEQRGQTLKEKTWSM